MPRILLVKTSSLGDVVHNLPVASDIHAAVDGAEIDWVVEEAYAPIARLHGGVRRVIPASVRRWRRGFWRRDVWDEVRAFAAELRTTRYDAVIDTQGLLKSALITRASVGMRYGLDWRASREPLFMFYDRTLHVPHDRHAVERNRSVAAQALDYTLDGHIDYGIAARPRPLTWLPSGAYAVLVHASSADAKLWPESRWIVVANALASRAMHVVLPWGDIGERERSERLAAALPRAIVPPRLSVHDWSAVLAGAACVVGVDTGLTHLAAALGCPTVGIYVATDPARTGLYRCARAVNVGQPGESPGAEAVMSAVERMTA